MQYLYQEAESFIKDIFWSKSHDKDNTLDIPAAIGSQLIKDNEEKDPEYYRHRPGVIHVSSTSKCLRGVVHEMLGTAKDVKDPKDEARKLGIFKAGNLFEDFIVESLREKMLDRQTEYVYSYKGIILTGRDDGTMDVDGTRKMLECKSVNSNAFWYRQKEGTLCAYQNQMQIQTYMWLRRILPNKFIRKHEGKDDEIVYTNLTKQALWEHRGMRPDDKLEPVEKPDESNLNGIFAYISKDDCTIAQAPVKFNQEIIDAVVVPALKVIIKAYEAKDPTLADVPALAIYSDTKGQWQKNWLCQYCDHHDSCCGAGWAKEATSEVARLNKEQGEKMVNNFQHKPDKPVITTKAVVPKEVLKPGAIIPVKKVLTNDDIAKFYKEKTGENAMVRTLETIMKWAAEQPEIVTNADSSLSFSGLVDTTVEKGGVGDPFRDKKSEEDFGDSSESDADAQDIPEGETTLEKMMRENKAK